MKPITKVCPNPNCDGLSITQNAEYLTLRDQFAIAALPALFMKYGNVPPIAQWAYETAELMLKQREHEHGDTNCTIKT